MENPNTETVALQLSNLIASGLSNLLICPNSNQLHEDLVQIVGEAGLLPDDQLSRYAIDGINPQVVVSPTSIHEIQEVLGYAADSELVGYPRREWNQVR